MEELVTKHAAVMDRYDPQKRVSLVVDEWGAWHQCEPGTNPAFLYQQNTLRDAMVAALTLNIFNRHSDRVRMANIAQTVNVLQAMILTDKEKMIVTPTYWVFEMYAVHQDAVLLPTDLSCADYRFGPEYAGPGASASRDKAGRIHVTLCNLNPNQQADVDCQLRGKRPQKVTGRLLTAAKIERSQHLLGSGKRQAGCFCRLPVDGRRLLRHYSRQIDSRVGGRVGAQAGSDRPSHRRIDTCQMVG